MNYSLDAYQQPLTTAQAAHLLRRATFGPTQSDIEAFTDKTSTEAIDLLITNINYNPAPPIDLSADYPETYGKPYIGLPLVANRNLELRGALINWWVGLMAEPTDKPSLAEKLTMFWQNHFVTEITVVPDHRAVYQYLYLIRTSILGNFKDFARDMTKEPAMLRYLNGHENEKSKPNENYARELQELFVVGEKDFAGNNNYTEEDVKAAARVLTGWRYVRFNAVGSTSAGTIFDLDRHDTTDKQFSNKYPNPVNPALGTIIRGRATNTAGAVELIDLLDMLLRHPESPKFICRKLYRFFVNPNVTQAVEDNVIIPLANLFKSQDPATGKTFEIKPVIRKLLMSQHFYDQKNIGSIIKAPSEIIIGTLKFLGFPTPSPSLDNLVSILTYRSYTNYIEKKMNELQMSVLGQPTVFGYDAYYQPGFSRNWINSAIIGIRNVFAESIVSGTPSTPTAGSNIPYRAKIDLVALVDKPTTASYDPYNCVHVVDLLTKNLFATELNTNQKDFLIDIIMLQSVVRPTWTGNWTSYKNATADTLVASKKVVKDRLENVMKYLLKMPEYQIF